MFTKVHKYPLLTSADLTLICVPAGSQVLHCAFQHGKPHVWIALGHDSEYETKHILIVGTGRDMRPAKLRFINTAFTDTDGSFVFHFFEVLP